MTAISPQEVVRSGLCIGCGSCVAQAGAGARLELDRYGSYRPAGAPEWLTARGERLARTCPFSPAAPDEDELARSLFPEAAYADPLIGRYLTAYVGHASPRFRDAGTSGGITTWVLTELL